MAAVQTDATTSRYAEWPAGAFPRRTAGPPASRPTADSCPGSDDRRGCRCRARVAGILAVRGRYVGTDDAYVHAAQLMVSTDVSGLVEDVAVHQGQHVKAGHVLFRINPSNSGSRSTTRRQTLRRRA